MGLYRILKGGSENEEWGRNDVMTGQTAVASPDSPLKNCLTPS
jgi:hypothetical protein